MSVLEEITRQHALRHGLDPAALYVRVRDRLEQWRQRGLQSTKKCVSCGRDRPMLAFAEDRRSGDGFQSRCRECDADRQRSRRVT
ncbi:hypothetical protein KRMM14A1259_21710 [Krasilnikovia sp. MM14-A1259]